ncbi:MAG TPA: phosphoenolpyruvate--protein phosphotransferase [Magnetospirillaceae bacterium]
MKNEHSPHAWRDDGSQRGQETVLRGLGVSPGVAIGIAHPREAGVAEVAEYRVTRDHIEAERQRLVEAANAASDEIDRLRVTAGSLPGAAGEEMGFLLDAYQQMLKGSRLIRGADRRIASDHINAEAAVQREVGEIARTFAAMEDLYLAARVDDIREVGRRLLRHLQRGPAEPAATLPDNAIVLAEELTPADTALFDPAQVAGFATALGGTTSHTAIMARSLGLPAIVGVMGTMHHARTGAVTIVDGSEGVLVIDPTPRTLERYRKKRADFLRLRRGLDRLAKVPAVTKDGVPVGLHANLELPNELDGVMAAGAVGIGLLRSEFLYMNRRDLPGEDEQYAVMRGMIERLGGRMLTMRTLDLGADKMAASLGIGQGPNPALGLRAIRLSIRHPELMETQFAAALRASAHGPVRILLPMVATVEEMLLAREVMDQVVRRLKRARIAIANPLPPLGAMIEVPGAALAADALAGAADFFAIGTNDLTQYVLAIDRSDEAVAHLYNPLHPAVLRLIQFATEAALRARIPVSVCGEIAGDERFTALLLGLGIRELSMAGTAIPRVKRRVLDIDLVAATRRARVIMDQSDGRRIAQLLDDFNSGAG